MSPNLRRILLPSSLTSSLSRNILGANGKGCTRTGGRRPRCRESQTTYSPQNASFFLRNPLPLWNRFSFPPQMSVLLLPLETPTSGRVPGCRRRLQNRKLLRFLHLIHQARKILLVLIKEYYTSQRCGHCKIGKLFGLKGEDGKVAWTIKRCSCCHLVLNRDSSGASIIAYLAINAMIALGRRPFGFVMPAGSAEAMRYTESLRNVQAPVEES
ncbi:hypothetical protein M427DRAFT_166337 [Gonapodya prolifera JEL478]|uniref:Cas12f1-like TNB domain-containing protein n=1 Tax=Gonapodya prolifera (strain JEL478) TaxID=1344416 RepID=A0A139AZN3_GONPJ|nr:hypothetical protein M427DRAFT_166337 [Gonapodya prolifera JEL478]|eukprot:KXS22167.1 hypothetical protein M427DRAFT_166337 [Gonapodya prolifera JEL478]